MKMLVHVEPPEKPLMLGVLASFLVVALCLTGQASAQVVRGDPLSPALRSGLLAAGADPSDQVVSVRGARLTWFSGGIELHSAARSDEDLAAELLTRFGGLFGVSRDLELDTLEVVSSIGTERTYRYRQVVGEEPVRNRGLVLNVSKASGRVSIRGELLIETLARAGTIRRAHAEAVAEGLFRAGSGRDFPGLVTAYGELRAIETANGEKLVYAVWCAGGLTLETEVFNLDAQTGQVLSRGPGLAKFATSTGNYEYDGGSQLFPTGVGRGSVFPSIPKALAGKKKTTRLGEVAHGTAYAGVAEDGFLFGRWVHPLNYAGQGIAPSSIVSPTYDWSFPVQNAQSADDAFDLTNTYYWMTRSAKYFDKVFGLVDSDHAIPCVVNGDNYPSGTFVTGYFHGSLPSSVPGAPSKYTPGFLVFNELHGASFGVEQDYSRDPTVVTHEYGHAVFAQEGIAALSDAINQGSAIDAMGEGFADYFSASYHKTTCSGPIIATYQSIRASAKQGACMRDLSLNYTFPDSVSFVPFSRHQMGQVVASALWRIRAALKASVADKLIASSSHLFSSSGGSVSDVAGVAAFTGACMTTLVDQSGQKMGLGGVGKVIGPLMEYGLLGSDAYDTVYELSLAPGTKLKWDSAFRNSIVDHSVDVYLPEGTSLAITIKGKKGTLVDFDIEPSDDLDFTKKKTLGSQGTVASQKGIIALVSGTYRVNVQHSGGGGVISGYRAILRASADSSPGCGLLETWSKGKPGVYPAKAGKGRKLKGDAGAWFVNDTFTEFNDCGQGPSLAKLVFSEGSTKLRLESSLSNGPCADNIWVFKKLGGVPVTPFTRLEFDETGFIPEGTPGSFLKRVFIELTTRDGYVARLTLQIDGDLDDYNDGIASVALEPAEPSGSHYDVALGSVFAMNPGFPVFGDELKEMHIEVNNGGWVEFDNIRICEGD
jgi:hypothetical protein